MKRFWDKVQKTATCWLWTSWIDQASGGYGRFWYKGHHQGAHRVAWALLHGSIPAGQCILHRCDTPACVNPEHLFLGTMADNNQDRAQKGRSFHPNHRGGRAPNARLTGAQVREIRAPHSQGLTQEAIASEFGVSRSNISCIITGKSWQGSVS